MLFRSGEAQYTLLDKQEIEKARILIATPEKAKAILRTNDIMVYNIKMVVMDEGHLLGNGDREIINEMFTEELRRIVKHNNGKFLVLSAVLPNTKDMSLWLTDMEDRVSTDIWRPSAQRFGLLCYEGNRVNLEWKGEFPCFNHAFVNERIEKKEAVAKVAIKLSMLGSILIYCPTTPQVGSNAKVMYELIKNEPDVRSE